MSSRTKCPKPWKDALTEAEASNRARHLNRKVPNTVQPYHCAAGHWHVGNPRPHYVGRGRRR